MTKLQITWLLGTALTLTGCQQKSVIDKCVEAQAVEVCNSLTETKTKAQPLYKVNYQSESQCVQEYIKSLGGSFQLLCLKAQSGKE
jgi:hypothetical protein